MPCTQEENGCPMEAVLAAPLLHAAADARSSGEPLLKFMGYQ